MLIRYGSASVLALGVTFGLFMLMRSLIGMGSAVLGEDKTAQKVDFIRVKEESRLQEKKRELPKHKKPEDAPPPPEMDMPDIDAADGDVIGVGAPDIETDVDMSGGPNLGMASDTDVIPLVRVRPMYPRGALTQGIEGYVLVEFTIDKKGKPKNVKVIKAKPPNMFDSAAVRAVRKWKYNPKIEGGKPVKRHGVRTRVEFEIPEEKK